MVGTVTGGKAMKTDNQPINLWESGCVCVCVRKWHLYKPSDERSDKPLPLPDCSLQLRVGCVCVGVDHLVASPQCLFEAVCPSVTQPPVSPAPLKACARACANMCVYATVTYHASSAKMGKVCVQVYAVYTLTIEALEGV